ncbi:MULTISPECIES: DUF3947 family protein [Bacillus]|uniref:DUF3947 family protein n=1 Tax=Bacillus TaxID=1386 RepID=UPI0019122988|nr:MULTISPECIES: DUF3947 family protein [Bacillus]MBK5470168.1 DUF3947 family protein [Bacillus sp. TH19]WOA57196.1 DUF3947 family protein [Bacillus mycoides]
MMNHYFYNGRQVGAAITLAGAQMTIQAVHQAIQMQQQAQVARMMQSQYMSYSQLPVQSIHYDVYPAGLSRYLPGSKTPTSKFGRSKEVRWEINCP